MIGEVGKNTVVTLGYHVTDFVGNMVDEGKEPLYYLHGGYDGIFPKIEETLEGKMVNDSVQIKLLPADAFGEYEAELVQIESRAVLPKDLEVGMQLEGAPEGAKDEDVVIYRVTEIDGDKVVLDGNHPLAGLSLIFNCTVTAIRAATAEEIEHGHVH